MDHPSAQSKTDDEDSESWDQDDWDGGLGAQIETGVVYVRVCIQACWVETAKDSKEAIHKVSMEDKWRKTKMTKTESVWEKTQKIPKIIGIIGGCFDDW